MGGVRGRKGKEKNDTTIYACMIKSMKGIQKNQVNDFQGLKTGVKGLTGLPGRSNVLFLVCVFGAGGLVWRPREHEVLFLRSCPPSFPRQGPSLRHGAQQLGLTG